MSKYRGFDAETVWVDEGEDLVRVVRCKDCRYHRETPECKARDRNDTWKTLNTDYCSYGERYGE